MITFPRAMSLHLNGESIQFLYTANAHTDGDAIAWFPKSNVVHMGDLQVILINSLLRIDQVGTRRVPRIFSALRAEKMVVHPCTTKEGLVDQTFLYISELYPIIDINSGGDINGYAPALDAVLAVIDDDTRVVPGHGRVGSKADLPAYRNMLVTTRDRVAAMVDDGRMLVPCWQPTRRVSSIKPGLGVCAAEARLAAAAPLRPGFPFVFVT